eukprot:SAG31_NODE_2121_length_6404_cov_17.936875_4_plen_88_part_00
MRGVYCAGPAVPRAAVAAIATRARVILMIPSRREHNTYDPWPMGIHGTAVHSEPDVLEYIESPEATILLPAEVRRTLYFNSDDSTDR